MLETLREMLTKYNEVLPTLRDDWKWGQEHPEGTYAKADWTAEDERKHFARVEAESAALSRAIVIIEAVEDALPMLEVAFKHQERAGYAKFGKIITLLKGD